MAAEPARTSEDAVLGGRLVLRQPLTGHRVGHDAILLAAASSARAGDQVVDLGARLAHSAPQDTLAQWLRTADRLLHPGGAVTLIWRADGLSEVLAGLSADFGAVAVLPVHPKPASPAIRVLVRAVKANGPPLSLLPGFFLNDAAGKPTASAEAVLRGGAALALAGS
jgi:tRNA1(Val) A37 N6-methylase TrmN6